LICALTGIVINQLFFIKGVSLTTVIHSSLLSLGSPIFITIIAAWLLKEGFTILKAIGLACGVGGASILILMKDQSGAATNMVLGDILVLINAISYAFYLVLVRPLMAKYSGIQVLRWIFTLGAIGILPVGLPYMLSTSWESFDFTHWVVLGYVAIFSTFVAYLLTVQSWLVCNWGFYLYATCICSHLCDDFHRRIFYFLQISGSHFNFYRRILSERKEVD